MAQQSNLEVLALRQFANDDAEFYANTISNHLQTSHLHINKPHKHNFYATFLFTRGSGIHEIDFNSFEVKPNVVFVLSPGQTHNWRLSPDAEGIIFFHSKEFYESHYLDTRLNDFALFSQLGREAATYFDQDVAGGIVSLFGRILTANGRKFPKRRQLLLSLITQLYIELENIGTDQITEINPYDRYYSKFIAFQNLLESHYREVKTVEGYAQMLNITPKHLNRINRVIVDKTTSQIIADRITLEAKRNLIYGKKNFAQIADELGFADYAHFSKLFKNKTGQTPSDFVKNYS